ncbi:unnamed protein product [Orchesella dallaii]|uniref:UDP-glucuronosyltransferase n=1 Tax=Orchesella dallaii TaxID=48710 RepID=A0ABP1QKL5_9HEXA
MLLSTFLVGFFFVQVLGEHIIFFHHVATYSHRVQTMPLAEALSKRGHQVTFISPFYPKEPNPNITEIVPKQMEAYNDLNIGKEFNLELRIKNKLEPMLNFVYEMGLGSCDALHKSSDFKTWLETTKKVDLVIIDYSMAECGIGLAYKLGAKYVGFSVVPVVAHEPYTIGFLPESSAIPELEILPPKAPMTFLQRVFNEITSIRWRLAHLEYSSKIDTLIRKGLDVPEMPFIGDLLRNISLVFYTGDVISDYPRSLPPLHVNVAGIHCKTPKNVSLPLELESFLNSSTTAGQENDGFVYISLGSLVDSSSLPENIKTMFFETIKAFPKLKFLWKWNGEFPKDIPSNLFLARWFPQLKLLVHPRIQGFITQSGRPSTMEALYHGVPMIAFPVIGDQDATADRVNVMGGNTALEIRTLNAQELKEAVQKMVYDQSVKTRMQRLKTIFRDRPMTPLDTAVWWTEYVLRSEDTSHLRPAGNYQYWFQRRQLDVWLFLFTATMISIFTILFLLKTIFRKICNEMSRQDKIKLT